MDEQAKQVKFVVDPNESGTRLDLYLSKVIPEYTRSKIQKLIEQKLVHVNHTFVPAKEKVKAGDTIFVQQTSQIQKTSLEPKKIELNILFEDDHLVVINKPAGLVVHPGAGESGATLAEGLLYHYGKIALGEGDDAWQRPGIVHRLDKDTSGVMVCAKSELAMAELSAQFHNKTNQREYLCLVNGYSESQIIERESYFFRDPDNRLKFKSLEIDQFAKQFGHLEKKPSGYRWAKTIFKREASYKDRVSLWTAKLLTGRTHQIRIHCADLKMAVLGDPLYSRQVILPHYFSDEIISTVSQLKRQMLHGRLLGFYHPVSKQQMIFTAEIPDDFSDLLAKFEKFRLSN